MPQVHDPVLEHLGKVFHVYTDDITREPLPKQWIELLQLWDKRERERVRQSPSATKRRDKQN
jgi:hypothetical protein